MSLFLLLDCTKGFDHSSHEWLLECLKCANTPEPVRLAVEVLIQNEPILRLKGKKFSPFKWKGDLHQGGPASTILFLISIDPLLAALEKMQGVVSRPLRSFAGRENSASADAPADEPIVSGFVDDWAA